MRILTVFVLSLLAGCGPSEAPKASHFEHDHFVAAHWPSDLADLSAKLRGRIASVRSGASVHVDDHEHDGHEHGHEDVDEHEYGRDAKRQQVPLREQIEDLVEWVGEVAADTNLSEADWIPLFEKSEAVSANLQANSDELTDDDLRELESLCELIDQASKAIPEQMPSWSKAPS